MVRKKNPELKMENKEACFSSPRHSYFCLRSNFKKIKSVTWMSLTIWRSFLAPKEISMVTWIIILSFKRLFKSLQLGAQGSLQMKHKAWNLIQGRGDGWEDVWYCPLVWQEVQKDLFQGMYHGCRLRKKWWRHE